MIEKIDNPEHNFNTDSVSNISGDVFGGNFRKTFIRDPIQTKTAKSWVSNATYSGQLTIYADQFKDSSNKFDPTQDASTIDAYRRHLFFQKDIITTEAIVIGDSITSRIDGRQIGPNEIGRFVGNRISGLLERTMKKSEIGNKSNGNQ